MYHRTWRIARAHGRLAPPEMSFFKELKRRNVYRVAAVYVVVSWLVLQVTDVVTSVLPLPGWTGELVFVLLAIGFPVALVLAWAFELTPEGLKREKDVPPDVAGVAPRGSRGRGLLIYGALAAMLVYAAWQYGHPDRSGISPGEIRSIAVLPFENLSNDPEQAFFVAGMHEALITELSKIESLRVISRTSSMRYRESDKSVPEIAQELGVDALVEGSVLKAGDVVRINVQLIAAEPDRHLWAENFDRELSDILALYSEVTRKIAKQISITLTADERALIANDRPVDPEVYELYLKARYLCENWSPEEMDEGVRLLEDAIEMEPGNAAAHAQLALCLQYEAFFGYKRPLDIFPRSAAAAATAVRLDDTLAEAHVAQAGVLYYLEFKPKAAMAALERALELDPSSVKALLHYSWLLGESGRFREGMQANQRAMELDPLSTVVNHAMGQLYYLNRDYGPAEEEFRKALELDRSDPSLNYSVALPNEQQGRFEDAIAYHRKAVELSGGASLYRAGLGYSYGLAGMREDAENMLQSLTENPSTAPYELAIVHLGLGHHDQAMELLVKAYDARDSQLIYINRGPKFDPLRSDPRFLRLVDKIGWPDPDAPLPGH